MNVSIIVAMTERRVIGRDGGLPWHLSADLKRFKRITWGHSIVMGRKTFDSIGRVLPGRESIVVTRQKNYLPEEVCEASSLEGAWKQAGNEDEVFVIGGAQIYEQALPRANRLYVTRVDADIEGDTFFPEFDPSQWRLAEESAHEADEKNDFAFTFQVFDRMFDDSVT